MWLLQENVGLKYFYMPMAGLGSSGCVLIADVLKSNRTVMELDVSYCRIPVSGATHIAAGLRENDVLQVFKVSKQVAWPFTPSQPARLYQGETHFVRIQ